MNEQQELAMARAARQEANKLVGELSQALRECQAAREAERQARLQAVDRLMEMHERAGAAEQRANRLAEALHRSQHADIEALRIDAQSARHLHESSASTAREAIQERERAYSEVRECRAARTKFFHALLRIAYPNTELGRLSSGEAQDVARAAFSTHGGAMKTQQPTPC